MIFKKYHIWLLALLSGLLLSCGWMNGVFQLLIFFGFVPLIILDEYYFKQSERYRSFRIYPKVFLAFIIWNTISTWWVWNASPSGAVMAIVFNSIFMATVFWIFHAVKRKLGRRLGYVSLIAFWLGFEFLHLNWELSWTWLTLGNALSENIYFIQWYEYTGILGGSLWILLINVIISEIIIMYIASKNIKVIFKYLTSLLIVFIVPITISLIIFYTYKEKGKHVNVVVVQPNIDPYNDKFGGISVQQQLEQFKTEALTQIDSNTDYIVGPETCIPEYIWEEDLNSHADIIRLKQLIYKFPKTKLVIGASTVRFIEKGEPIAPSAQKYSANNEYYDSFNTALQFDSTNNVQIYHKSKLVLGVERMPFAGTFGFLNDMAIELGGSASSLGSQAEPSVFTSNKNVAIIAPVICYESIFGEYVTEYIKKGANLIFVITNDGWWGNSAGYRQHLSYSSLRAIETRRDIARSANTGISCFINQLGKIRQATAWWTPTAIKDTLLANNGITFYVKMGDYIGRIAAFVSVLIFIYFLSLILRKLFYK